MTNFPHEFFIGGLAGAVGIFVGHPFDTVRIRLQVDKSYKGAWSCIKSTAIEEGIQGFFRGLAPPLIGAWAVNAVLFYTFNFVETKLILQKKNRMDEQTSELLRLNKLELFFAGCVSGAMSCLISSPIELLKCRLQVKHQAITSYDVWKMGLSIYKQKGIRNGLYHGFFSTVLRDIPGFGSYYFFYFDIKHRLVELSQKEENPIFHMLAGGLAGSLSWIVSYPTDVIKSRIQTQPLLEFNSKNYWNIILQMWKLEGNTLFFRGLGTTVIRAFPTSAATFLVYESLMNRVGFLNN